MDVADTDWKTWGQAWPQVLNFLRGLQPTEHFAIYALDPARGLQVLQDYSDDLTKLLNRLLQRQNPTLATLMPPASAAIEPVIPFATRNDQLEAPQLLSYGRVQGLIAALNVISDHLAGAPGKKSLIWLSGHFPNPFHPSQNMSGSIDPVMERYRLQMLRPINRLIASDVVTSPIDARGLVPDPRFDVSNEDIGIHPIQGAETQNSLVTHDFSPIEELANRSGGKAYYNTNGFAKSIRDAAIPEEASYILGFYPTSLDAPDNKFHKISVVVRRPGMHLRYRPGYWALSISPGDLDASRDALKTALDSPLTANSIGMQADGVLSSGSKREFTLVVHVNPRNLSLRKERGLWAVEIDYIYGQKDQTNRVFAIPPFRKRIQLTDSEYEQSLNRWIQVQATLSLRV